MKQQPSQDSRKRAKAKGAKAVDLPDAEAIRQLFPKKAVEKVNKDASHERKITHRKQG